MGRINSFYMGIVACFLLAVIFFMWPLLAHINYCPSGGHDSDEMLARMYLERESILKYKQFPFWTPYLWGGTPLFVIASMMLSPFFILILIFGEIIGLKLCIIAHFCLGGVGMYLLSRRIGCSKVASCVPSIIFFFSSIYPLQIAEGIYYNIAIAWIPWVLLFYFRSLVKRKYVFIAAIFCTFILFGGGAAPVLFFVMTFLLVYSLLEAWRSGNGDVLANFFFLNVLVLLMGAVHWFSLIDVSKKIGFIFKYTSYMRYNDVTVFWDALFSRNQLLNVPRSALWRLPENVGFWEQRGAYIGAWGLLFYLFGLRCARKYNSSLLLTNLVFLFLSTINIFFLNEPLRCLYQNMPDIIKYYNYPRFIWMFVFSLSLIAGIGLTVIEEKLFAWGGQQAKARGIASILPVGRPEPRNAKLVGQNWLQSKQKISVVCGLAILFLLFDLVYVNRAILQEAFTAPPQVNIAETIFRQTRGEGAGKKGQLYDTVLRNQGASSEIFKILIINNTVSYGAERYRGEAYLDRGKVVDLKIVNFSPNVIKISVRAQTDDLLVVNQNYDPNWKVKGASDDKVICFNGLVAARVSPANTGDITFYYHPSSFFAGLFITVLALFFVILGYRGTLKTIILRFLMVGLLIFSFIFVICEMGSATDQEFLYYSAINAMRKGCSFLRERKFADAEPFLQKASIVFPNSIALHEKLKDVYSNLGNRQKLLFEEKEIAALIPRTSAVVQ